MKKLADVGTVEDTLSYISMCKQMNNLTELEKGIKNFSFKNKRYRKVVGDVLLSKFY